MNIRLEMPSFSGFKDVVRILEENFDCTKTNKECDLRLTPYSHSAPIKNLPTILWTSTDHIPMEDREINRINNFDFVYSNSITGVNNLRLVGINCIGHVPDPVNLEAYKSIDKIEAKKALNFSEDDFVVGFCGPNKSSSLIPNLIEAFTQFVLWNASHKKNLVLLIATDNKRS